MTALLELDGLSVALPIGGRARRVLHDVSFTIAAGEALGLVGESGSGKSMTARAVGRLLPAGATVEGGLRFDGQDVGALSGRALRSYRGDVAMVFQDPRAHVNPVRTIGDFMTEALRTVRRVRPAEAERRATEALEAVGVSGGARRLRQYPHELSGGLLQRVMIAGMLLTEPRLLLADEPTTALDVTTQSEVMAIVDELRRDRGMALLFITHDLELAAAVCDRTAVMYAGLIVETRDAAALEREARHPYTASLAGARPRIDRTAERLRAIPGRPVSAFEAPPDQCPFAPRCPFVADACTEARPELRPVGEGLARCVRADEIHATVREHARV
ncbi:ABC transporter ATP-binding protein [Patulibacter sp. S7RM1-6]